MGDKITEMLKKVRQIEIRTNRQVSENLAGAYRSVFKGRGMDFEEAREYQPGDEIRSIDWNVTARTGKAHVKKYREERELTMMLAVDLSASGQFGSGDSSKREIAAEIASTLAFSAARNNDKVGLVLFTEDAEHIIPPRKGRRHILRLIRDILAFEPQHRGTNIARALEEVNRILKRRAIVVLVSDFLQGPDGKIPDPEGKSEVFKALDITNRRHDLVCFEIVDPRETVLPALGVLTLEDSETGEIVSLDTSSTAVRKTYAEINARRLADFKRALARSKIDLLEIRTDKPFITPLRKFFERRAKRQ
ncbi:DUF58 domain-containing protein [Opitutia bacterium KCR 482]|nr:DUF58 domain-containing protein [Opitutae bacterium KCR 482]